MPKNWMCVCRMENRNVRDEEEELKNEELVVVDVCEVEEEMMNEEWKEDASDATSASAGKCLIHILL